MIISEIDSETSQFKSFYKEFLRTINENDLDRFGNLKSDEERINFVFSFPSVHTYDISVGKYLKSAETAKQFKDNGNRAFQVNQYQTALELYSRSIIKQPQDTSNDKEELSIMFANRSAALYHMQDYQPTLEDIQSAFEYNYPSNLQFKIYDRKARCLLALNHFKSAREAFRQTIQALDVAKLSAERRQKWQRDIQIMLAMLEKNKQLTNASKNSSEKIPLKGGANKKYPDLSSMITIKEAPQLGRFTEANSDIKPGDFLLRETSHCAVLLDQFAKSHCFQCFRRATVPYPCPQCSNVVFCGKPCQAMAMQSHHHIECPVLPSLWHSGASVTCLMALRIITQHDLDYFLQIKPSLMSSTRNRPYKSNDYIRVYDLVNHSTLRTREDFLHRTVMAVFLLRCLQTTGYFKQQNENALGSQEKMLTENESFIGGLMLRHLQSLQFNSHEVAELLVTGTNKKSVFIGGAVYPTLALFNHSCNPGIVRYHKGTEVYVRAVRTIRKGDFVCENYGPIFTEEERPERRATLKTQYWFDCECEACLDDWPTLNNMSVDIMRFRCDCGSIVLIPIDTREFMVPCQRCKQHTNIFKGLKVLQDTDMMFRVAKSLVEEGKNVAALNKFLELLTLLDTTLAPPFRDYHICQQEIRTCMLACGNTHADKQ